MGVETGLAQRNQPVRSEAIACWQTLSRKKQKRLPSSDRAGELSANRKGSVDRLATGVHLSPFMELGPARVDLITGGVRGRKAAGNDPVYEIDHLRLDHAARLRFLNLIYRTDRVGFFLAAHVRSFCVAVITAG